MFVEILHFLFLRLTIADFVLDDCMNFLSFNCIRIYNTPYTRYVYSCYSSIQYLNLHSVLRMKGYESFSLSYIRSSLCAKADTFSAMYFALLSRMTYCFNKNQNYVYTSL